MRRALIETALALCGINLAWWADSRAPGPALGAWCLALGVGALLIGRRLTCERRAEVEADGSPSGRVGAPEG